VTASRADGSGADDAGPDAEQLPDGSLRTGGVVFRRTPRRVTRRVGRDLVAAGAVVVVDVYPDGLRTFTGPDARAAWAEVEPALVTGRRPAVRDLQWVGHVWESDHGDPLLRFDGEH